VIARAGDCVLQPDDTWDIRYLTSGSGGSRDSAVSESMSSFASLASSKTPGLQKVLAFSGITRPSQNSEPTRRNMDLPGAQWLPLKPLAIRYA
jgi:hypothetical protein